MSLAALPESEPLAGASRTNVSPQLLHDLRSPLNHIIGYSEMLTEEVDAQRREGFATDVEKIRDAGHRRLAIIEENFTSAHEAIPVLHETESPVPPDAAAQNVSIGTATANNSALLHLESTTKGFLMPRMSDAQMWAISSPSASWRR